MIGSCSYLPYSKILLSNNKIKFVKSLSLLSDGIYDVSQNSYKTSIIFFSCSNANFEVLSIICTLEHKIETLLGKSD